MAYHKIDMSLLSPSITRLQSDELQATGAALKLDISALKQNQDDDDDIESFYEICGALVSKKGTYRGTSGGRGGIGGLD